MDTIDNHFHRTSSLSLTVDTGKKSFWNTYLKYCETLFLHTLSCRVSSSVFMKQPPLNYIQTRYAYYFLVIFFLCKNFVPFWSTKIIDFYSHKENKNSVCMCACVCACMCVKRGWKWKCATETKSIMWNSLLRWKLRTEVFSSHNGVDSLKENGITQSITFISYWFGNLYASRAMASTKSRAICSFSFLKWE